MKVLFLDIDGVLNTPKSTGRFGIDFVDNTATALVARIVKETDCKIVLSSTWRIDEQDRKLATRELNYHGLEIYDYTPILKTRNEEIQTWINQNKISKYAILDDMTEAEIAGHFFKTNENVGLTVTIAEKIIAHLKNPS